MNNICPVQKRASFAQPFLLLLAVSLGLTLSWVYGVVLFVIFGMSVVLDEIAKVLTPRRNR